MPYCLQDCKSSQTHRVLIFNQGVIGEMAQAQADQEVEPWRSVIIKPFQELNRICLSAEREESRWHRRTPDPLGQDLSQMSESPQACLSVKVLRLLVENLADGAMPHKRQN